VVYYTFYAN
jgi:hypothetical protein